MRQWEHRQPRSPYGWRRFDAAAARSYVWTGAAIRGYPVVVRRGAELLAVQCYDLDLRAYFMRPLLLAEADLLPFPVMFVNGWSYRLDLNDEEPS